MRPTSLVYSLFLLLPGCIGQPNPSDVQGKIVPKGFTCSVAPSEAYSPGYVYRVDSSGAELLVSDLSAEVPTFSYGVVLPSYDASLARDAGLKFSLLRGSGSNEASLGATGSTSSRVSFQDGRLVLMTDTATDALLTRLSSELTPKTGSRYYVVRDAITASGIDLRISSADEARLGGEAQLSRMFSASPSVKFNRTENLNLVSSFGKSLNVCARITELLPNQAAPDDTLVSEGPRWRLSSEAPPSKAVAAITGN